MDNRKTFEILDNVAIRVICAKLSLHDNINLKQCSKKLNYIVSKYLADVTYQHQYLIHQYDTLGSEIFYLKTKIAELKRIRDQVFNYTLVHSSSIKPDGYMSKYISTRHIFGSQWIYCSVEYAITNFVNGHLGTYQIFVKSGQPKKRYDRILTKMKKLGFQRVFPPKPVQENPEIKMMFTKKGCELYKPYHNCKVCGKDHILQKCNKVVCNICKQKGHLTQRCPSAYCTLCKIKGSHITSRCPKIKCKNCGKKGHIQKRCVHPSNKHVTESTESKWSGL